MDDKASAVNSLAASLIAPNSDENLSELITGHNFEWLHLLDLRFKVPSRTGVLALTFR